MSFHRFLLTTLLALLACGNAWADRVKDLATVAAGRSNQLIGFGLVVGLQGTGDGSDVSFTTQSMKAILGRLGISVDVPLSDFSLLSGAEKDAKVGKIDVKNTAAVLVTAELPGFAKPGQKIDVNVSAIGKASSLRGGNLILTSLRGVDGEIYGIAQGALTATGVESSAAGSKVSIGVPTSARIAGGATVERLVENPFEKASHIVMNVREADFTTTSAIVNAINKNFGDGIAKAIDGMSLAVKAPTDLSQRVNFMSLIENLDVQPGEPPARVVVNAKTGTVVISRNVKVSAAAVAHGTISVAVTATNEVSQPGAFSQGQTTPVQNADIKVEEPKNPMFLFQPGVDLRQIVDAVNQVGATPSALIAILEALKSSGSLRADLIII
ncbi:flagellar basal body P-ring protein FlgI [Limnohabitans radicicola]|uniref:Flagellar P-ring protein n=1 Tax=Limnohabitans radicicola TaxID=2771427 RepID=A0A927IKA2_9BURK|nr:flagellar basal body P-ring protein FlgI [Limnohabitans radicicola]MBD8048951.1 flagellar basal body P-ring protein FlgI [Limnohabitans radicicola]